MRPGTRFGTIAAATVGLAMTLATNASAAELRVLAGGSMTAT